ncbi:MAG: DUF1573 domain-containing protein [Dysgonamonadaceae bacterium]|jgi:hypothetical protein|nr:DUF1573 domain-containing protein [Dysgonamonadaceae bacterium]
MKKKIYKYNIFAILLFSCTNTELNVSVPANIDFGIMQYGDKVKREAVVKNLSPKDITIDYIATTCDCYIAKAREMLVKAGDSTIVDITYHATETGYIERVLPIHFIGYNTTVNIIIKGRVKLLYNGIITTIE